MHNVSLNNFVSGTSRVKELHLPGLEREDFSYKDPYSFFWSDYGLCVAQNQGTFEDQSVIIKVKKYLHWSIVGRMLLHMGRIQAK